MGIKHELLVPSAQIPPFLSFEQKWDSNHGKCKNHITCRTLTELYHMTSPLSYTGSALRTDLSFSAL